MVVFANLSVFADGVSQKGLREGVLAEAPVLSPR